MSETVLCVCPYCGEEVSVKLLVPDKTDGKSKRDRLTPKQIVIIEEAEKNGLLKAFEQAVDNGPGATYKPRDIGVFFLTCLKTARPKIIPKDSLNILIDKFGQLGKIEFYSSQGIGIVTVDRKIKMFVPIQLVCGEAMSSAYGGAVKLRMDVDTAAFSNWVKTRMGYVPADNKIFLDELRKRSIGEFSNPNLSV